MTKETRQQAQFLLARYIGKQASPQEEALLFDLMNKEENSQDWEEMLEELMMLEEENKNYDRAHWQPVVERIIKNNPSVTKKVFRLPRWSIAASILLVLGVAGWLLFRKEEPKQQVVVQQPASIAPGKEGAVLTLSDGSKMVLDSLGNGVIATQSGTLIELKNGRLTYRSNDQRPGAILYNTMATPRGRQFQLVLPDGSKVWLNAESSIRYPVAFTGEQRRVEINGEAYFEVVHDANKPFRVVLPPTGGTEGGIVEVLGTHFNINAYQNEPAIAATLLQGKIKLSTGSATGNKPSADSNQQSQIQNSTSKILQPGQQGKIQSGDIAVVNNVDTGKVMAWKNGAFNFEGASLEQLMRQLERWYDITVVYENGIPQKEFTGEIGRNVKLEDVVEALQSLSVHLRLEGRTLIVSP